jgi:hypothetical protein
MLLAIACVAKFVQNCQNLPKDNLLDKLWNITKNWDFGAFPKEKLLCIEEAPKHVPFLCIFNSRVFHIPFYCLKMAFVCEFQHTPLCLMTFSSRFHTSYGYGILWNSPRNKNVKSLNPYLLQKIGFLASKHYCIPWAHGRNFFSLTLNVMILQMVMNECIRFGGM